MELTVTHHRRGDPGYEDARCKAVWNGRKPDRYPELICIPETRDDVVLAVKYASAHEMSIGVLSSGHSWTASFLRDGGMLIDLGKLTEIVLELDKGMAQVQPGVHGGDLNAKIRPHDYIFPSGHHPSVGIAGFLIQGGFGWNSRLWGPACESVLEVEVVTVNGDLVHASPTQHEDLYWAVRGAGPGFFGIVTKFYLRLHPLPKSMMTSIYNVPADHLDRLLLDLEAVQPRLPQYLELSVVVGRDLAKFSGLSALIVADTLAPSLEEARASLQMIEDVPTIEKAIFKSAFVQCQLNDLLNRAETVQSGGLRYHVDNVWSDASMTEILPSIHNIVDNIPPAPAHLYMLFWGPTRVVPDMAFSMQGNLWFSFYCTTTDPALDRKYSDLVVEKIGEFYEKVGKGTQLSDENLINRASKFMASDNFSRLQAIRKKYDPQGRFHSYFRLPEEFEKLKAIM